MPAFDFHVLVGNLQQIGFYGFVLPWIFAFAVVYGILETAQIFRRDNKPNRGVNGMIALVIAFYLTIYTPYGSVGTYLSTYFSTLFGGGIVVLAALLVILLLFGMVGFKPTEVFSEHKVVWTSIFLIIGALLFMNASGLGIPNIAGGLTEFSSIFIFVAIIAFAIYFITKEEAPAEKK